MRLDEINSRIDIWKDAWAIVAQHPWGVGPGNYQVVEPIFKVHFQSQTITYQTHNDYLQLLVETGWPGFLLLTGGFLYVLVRGLAGVRQVYKREEYSPRFFVVAGAWSGLISLAWHSYFDFNLQIPANLFYFAMLIGIVVGGWRTNGQRSEVRGRRSEGRGQRAEVGDQRSEVRGQTAEDGQRTIEDEEAEGRREARYPFWLKAVLGKKGHQAFTSPGICVRNDTVRTA